MEGMHAITVKDIVCLKLKKIGARHSISGSSEREVLSQRLKYFKGSLMPRGRNTIVDCDESTIQRVIES